MYYNYKPKSTLGTIRVYHFDKHACKLYNDNCFNVHMNIIYNYIYIIIII